MAGGERVGRVEEAGRVVGEIAGHALALGLVLVTHNTREFARVPGTRDRSWA